MDNENTVTAQVQEQKTFTQDDVNRIVGERLSKDRSRNEADFVKGENDLKQRELAMTAREMLAEKGLPKDLADVLKFSDEETLKTAIDKIQKFRSKENGGYVLINGGQNRLPESDNSGDDDEYSLKKAFGLTD